MMLFGNRVIEDASLVEPAGEDWSRVRSPARARRRRRKHRQNIVQLYKPQGTITFIPDGRGGATAVMHPAIAAELRRHVSEAQRFYPWPHNPLR